MLEFRPLEHQYLWDGTPCPSVTQVLGEFVKVERGEYSYYVSTFTGNAINADLFDAAADHGTAVHEAARIILSQGPDALDWEALHEDLVHPLRQLEEWVHHFMPRFELIETPLYHQKLKYAGTADMFAWINGKLTCIDIKTGAHSLAAPQLYAYCELYKDNFKYRPIIEKRVLSLPKDKNFKYIRIDDSTAWDFFRSRLYQFSWLQNRKKG